jgi:hypothetical protein
MKDVSVIDMNADGNASRADVARSAAQPNPAGDEAC